MTQTESNQEVTKTDNHAAGYYKIIIKSLDPLRAKKTFIRKKLGHTNVLGCKLICMRFINSLYNKIVRSIALLDNIAILFVQVNFHTSQSFGDRRPLKHSCLPWSMS